MKYGKDLVDDDNSFIFSSLKSVLKKRRNYLLENAIWGSLNTDGELDDIERVLELIETNKIKINGRFRIEKSFEGKGRRRQKICWQSVHSIGNEVETATGKQWQGWATVILQEALIKNIAEKQGLLINDKERDRWGESFDDGSEAYVYNDPDDESKIIKTIEYLAQNKSLPDFFERTIGYNALFPDTAYDIVGFIEDDVRENLYDRSKMLKPVLKQPYVYGRILAKLPYPGKEFEKFLYLFQKLGYTVNFEEGIITKDGYEASDLNLGNVIKTPSGQYRVIDAWVRKVI